MVDLVMQSTPSPPNGSARVVLNKCRVNTRARDAAFIPRPEKVTTVVAEYIRTYKNHVGKGRVLNVHYGVAPLATSRR